MQFRRTGNVGGTTLDITLSSDIKSYESLFKISGTGSVLDSYEGAGIHLAGADTWHVNPAFIRNSNEMEIFGENTANSLIINAYPHSETLGSDATTKIVFPSLSLLKAAAACAEGRITKLPNQISNLDDDTATAVWQFLNLISDVVRYNDYLGIVESLSEINPAFRFELSNQAGNQIKQMLVGWESNAEFRIESYDDLNSRIDDFEGLSTIQKLPRSIDKEEALADALTEVATEGTLQDIVDLCRALNLSQNHPELVQNYQTRAIIAQCLIEGNLQEAWTVAQNTLDFESTEYDESYEQLSSAAMDERESATKADLWGVAIMHASGDYETRTAIANYLYWTARTTNGNSDSCTRLYEAAYHGFLHSEITHMAQYAKYNHFAQLGYRHLQEKENQLAGEHFLQAYVVASNATNQFEHRLPDQCITAIKNWATAFGDHYRYQGKYAMGIHVLKTAASSIEILELDSDDDQLERSLQRLRAKQRILEMEQNLTQAEYELALEIAGNIIGIYAELNDQDSQEWGITKRKEIQAIVFETNGELNQAANLHRSIGETWCISDQRRHWHIHRGDICKAKRLALDGEYERAKSQLLEIQTRTNRLESEANDLAVMLDAVIVYQQCQQTPFQTSVQQLSQSDDQIQRVPPMQVEYNYEGPLSVIHAAQWLRSYNVAEELLLIAVEVALQASLIPLHAGEAAATIGIDEVDLRDQWINQLPTPVSQRIKQIELDKTVPQTDYVGLGSRLFNLVELYLAIISEYFGTREWGAEWRANLSEAEKTKNMALGDLANVFDRCAEHISSSDEADRLVNGDGTTPSVTKLRNDIGHIKKDDINKAQFKRFYDRIMEIFRTTADDVPVIGRKIETRGEGSFQRELVQLQWWRPLRLAYIQTDAQLTDDKLYYFPQDPIAEAGEQNSVMIPSDKVIPVSTDRISDKF